MTEKSTTGKDAITHNRHARMLPNEEDVRVFLEEIALIAFSLFGITSQFALGCSEQVFFLGDAKYSSWVLLIMWWILQLSRTLYSFHRHYGKWNIVSCTTTITDFVTDKNHAYLILRLWIVLLVSIEYFVMSIPNALGGCKNMLPFTVACLHIVLLFVECTSKLHKS